MRLNLNQVQVAADTGVTRQTILAIEKDRLTPSVTLALRLARVLREPVDYVFYLDRVPVEAPRQEAEKEPTTNTAPAAFVPPSPSTESAVSMPVSQADSTAPDVAEDLSTEDSAQIVAESRQASSPVTSTESPETSGEEDVRKDATQDEPSAFFDFA